MRDFARALSGLVLAALGAGCSPLGPPVDGDVSGSYYLSRARTAVVYCATGNWFKLGHTVLEADRRTFRPLAEAVGVDQERVFYRAFAQPHVDRATFEVDGFVLRDAKHVYFPQAMSQTLAVLDGADPATFRYLLPDSESPRQWAQDARRVYLDHEPLDVDAATFRFVNRGFTADDRRIYTRRTPFRAVADIAEPWEVLNPYHIRMGHRILSAGTWPARILEFDKIREIRPISSHVLVVNDTVFARGVPFPVDGVDAATFSGWPDHETFARDANAVYYIYSSEHRIEGADPATFAPIAGSQSYARDAHRIYYEDTVLEDADRETFEIVREGERVYARDRHGRFFMGRRER